MNLNKAMVIGNLTRDPEIRTTPTGQTVASFSVATNYVWTDQSGQKRDKAEFHNIVAWRRLAEICGQYLKKGSKIYIEGRMQTRDWVGQDGVKRYRTEIIAEKIAARTVKEEKEVKEKIKETDKEKVDLKDLDEKLDKILETNDLL